ncbi:MAG TPA: hypothetical protein VN325_08145 [Steroidobacteraceae bacterium]|nr:hypothetical protein [Steroidobacteraceae bacterium]
MDTKNQVLDDYRVGPARAGLDASLQSSGVRFTGAVQRSWGSRRPVNAGLLALSILQGDVRRRLLGDWMESGGGTASYFAADADSLLDFIAEQLPDPSPELALCRVEQLTLRAASRASDFEAPDPALLEAQRAVRRACHAGVVLFPGGSRLILSKLLPFEPLASGSRDATPLVVAPGLEPLCRIASRAEYEIWTRLTRPTAVHTLVRNGGSLDVIGTLLRIGALEYP